MSDSTLEARVTALEERLDAMGESFTTEELHVTDSVTIGQIGGARIDLRAMQRPDHKAMICLGAPGGRDLWLEAGPAFEHATPDTSFGILWTETDEDRDADLVGSVCFSDGALKVGSPARTGAGNPAGTSCPCGQIIGGFSSEIHDLTLKALDGGDAYELAEFFDTICGWIEVDDHCEDYFDPRNLDDFIQLHNWRDPVATSRVSSFLQWALAAKIAEAVRDSIERAAREAAK